MTLCNRQVDLVEIYGFVTGQFVGWRPVSTEKQVCSNMVAATWNLQSTAAVLGYQRNLPFAQVSIYLPLFPLPRRERVVWHKGKIQEREEVLGADNAKAFGQVWMHPVKKIVPVTLSWPRVQSPPNPASDPGEPSSVILCGSHLPRGYTPAYCQRKSPWKTLNS